MLPDFYYRIFRRKRWRLEERLWNAFAGGWSMLIVESIERELERCRKGRGVIKDPPFKYILEIRRRGRVFKVLRMEDDCLVIRDACEIRQGCGEVKFEPVSNPREAKVLYNVVRNAVRKTSRHISPRTKFLNSEDTILKIILGSQNL